MATVCTEVCPPLLFHVPARDHMSPFSNVLLVSLRMSLSVISGFCRDADEISAEITQSRVLTLYWRFGTCRSRLQQGSRVKSSCTAWPLKMGPMRCSETSVKVYHLTLRNTPDERRSHHNCFYLSVTWTLQTPDPPPPQPDISQPNFYSSSLGISGFRFPTCL
jgi:hypothetical protein